MTFQEELEKRAQKKLKLRLNDNRATMLSVKWEPDCTRVSMHRMFLQAPQNVMDALACYIVKEQKSLPTPVKSYIEEGLKKLDYSKSLDATKLYIQGNVHNLRHLYNQVNDQYFNNEVDLQITWFGKPINKRRREVTFGLYCEPLKLIKIHRRLDNPSYPDYLVSFIIYHEMLHHLYPPYVDKKGRTHIHNREFKRREKLFQHYDLAQDWIERNHPNLFIS